jgi:hypothetical protein
LAQHRSDLHAGRPGQFLRKFMDKYTATRVPTVFVLKELGYVPWPPLEEGDECVCGCALVGDVLSLCEQHMQDEDT